MATVATLLKQADDMYPNAVTTENKVDFMNMAQDDISRRFGNTKENYSLVTIAGVDAYELPTDIDSISDIDYLAIGNTIIPQTRYDYTQYKRNLADTNPISPMGYYQAVDDTGSKRLILTPTPTISGLQIVIRYTQRLPRLSAEDLSFEPRFDPRYHSLLSLYCCHMICSVGASPDAYQADMFMQKYQNLLTDFWKERSEQVVIEKRVRTDNRQWHRRGGKSFGRGGNW